MFDSINIATTGVAVYRKWLDAVSDNIANVNDASPTSGSAYQAEYVQAGPVAGGQGAVVTGIQRGSAAGREVYQPGNPLADANGMVRYPDIDLSDQMGQLIMAERGYQANLAVVDRAHDAYQAALQLGKNA